MSGVHVRFGTPRADHAPSKRLEVEGADEMQRSDAPVGGFSLLLDPLKKVLDEPRLHEVLKAIEEDEKHGIHLDPKTDVHEYMRQRKQRQQHLGSLYQRIARYLARPQRGPFDFSVKSDGSHRQQRRGPRGVSC